LRLVLGRWVRNNQPEFMAVTNLIGRDDALGAMRAFLGAVERGPAALVLSGEAGIGKTVLWEAGLAMAGVGCGRVLSCRGIGAEAALSFAGLSDLLSTVMPEVSDSLLPVRRRALEVALLLADPDEAGADARAIGVALLDVLRRLAESGSVIVAVDDLQWLDGASAAALALALRRVGTERIGFLATVREAPDTAVPFELERVFPEGRLRCEHIGPLEVASLHRLIRGRRGLALSRPAIGRIAEASGGNPFFALELGRAVGQTGVEPESQEPVPVPGSLSTLLGARLDRLPAHVREVLLVVALAGRPTAELVASAHGDRDEALAALELAAGEGVVALEGSRVRFAHPLFASVCHEQAPIWRRQAVHRALAVVVADPEERARHLALAAGGPDAFVASELEAAAEHAAARGATAAAAGLAELAADLTPPESEGQRRRRRSSAAWFHRLAGDLERACAILEELLVEVPNGPERSDVLYALATTGRPDMAARVRLCGEAALHATGDDVRLVQILGFRAISRWIHGDVPGALIDAREGMERAGRVGDQRLLAMALARVGLMEAWALEVTPGLLERGISIEERLERPLLFHESPRLVLAVRLLSIGDDLERAREMLEAVERDAVARGDEHTRAWVVLQLQILEYHAGHLQRAFEFSRAAHDVAEQTGELQYEAMVCACQARVEADMGLVDQARATAGRGLACARQIGDEIFTVFNLAALGAVEVGLANNEEAARHLRDVPARLLSMGHRAPGPTDPWPNAIEALIAVGELERARAYLEHYELHAQLAPSGRAFGGAARSRALLAAAEGDLEAASSAIERSLAQLEDARFPLELARTLLAAGSIARQATHKRASRDALLRALAIFEELPAPLWAEKARAELRRISGRRPADEELSESERRVAALASDGKSNKEIAAALYVSVRTVETHLTHIYRKLGVRSRTELARLVITAGSDAKAAGDEAKVP
jgi:DNA-binding CsgD family transcriptional regulator